MKHASSLFPQIHCLPVMTRWPAYCQGVALAQLLYFSDVREIGMGGVTALLEQAREKNADRGLTGVLLFNPNYFLQCLEGGREAVTAAFCRIAADRRHANVTLVSVHDIEARDFPDWTMGYLASTSSDVNAVLREFLPTEEFAPRLLQSGSAIELMKRIRGMNGTG